MDCIARAHTTVAGSRVVISLRPPSRGRMSTHVCLSVNTFSSPEDVGRVWSYCHWALGLLALGCRVSWLEELDPEDPPSARRRVIALKDALRPYGLADGLALCCATPEGPALAE